MPNTMTLIASSTVGAGGSTTITFSSIPSTYTDLVIKYSLRNTLIAATDNVSMTFNGTASGYADMLIYGNGSSALSASRSSRATMEYFYQSGSTATSDTFSNADIYITNYTSSAGKNVNIDSVTENNATAAVSGLDAAAATAVTSAITSITLGSNNGTFVQNSTAYLYGISKS